MVIVVAVRTVMRTVMSRAIPIPIILTIMSTIITKNTQEEQESQWEYVSKSQH